MNAFISGWCYSAEIFTKMQSYSAADILLELPFYEDVTLELAVNDLAQKIPDNTHLTGWSLGGLLAIKIAAMFPKKISSLTLLSVSPRFLEGENWEGISKNTADQFTLQAKDNLDLLLKKFLLFVNYPQRRISDHYMLDIKNKKQALLSYLDMLFNVDLREEYARISVPITHVIGELDAVTKINVKELAHLNSKAKFKIKKKVGHLCFVGEVA